MRIRSLLSVATILSVAGVASAQATAPVKVTALTAEHERNPIGMGFTQPRLSWKLVSDRPGEVQTAYEIRAEAQGMAVGGAGGNARTALVRLPFFDTNKVVSDQSVLVPWPGKGPLSSRLQTTWQVRVWDKDGNPSAWSDPAVIEMGILDPKTEWKGQWITNDLPRFDIMAGPLAKASWISQGALANQAVAACMTLELPADAKVASAVVDANADGLLALYVNGKATKQGPSSHTAPFHADFPEQLKPGANKIGLFSLAVRMARGGGSGRNALAAHGVIELEGGQRIEFNTDGTWKASVVPATGSNTPNGWTFDDGAWQPAAVVGPYSAYKPVPSADSTVGPGRYFRKTFTIRKPVLKARLYSTALGTYEASLNGQPVNDHQLDPGWTDYTKRVMVQTTDVTALLAQGPNTLGAVLTDGWFAGRVGWMGLAQYARVSNRPLFNAQLEITYGDGTSETIATDSSWQSAGGEIVGADEQLGEVMDGRQASQPDAAWSAAVVDSRISTPLVPQVGPPVRRLMELAPQKITRFGAMWLVDFGQNFVGHVRLRARGPAGTTIQVQHGEMRNSDGTLYNENLRQAIALDTFILGGTGGPEVFEPQFTFHGFRYAQITGYPGDLTADDIRGIVVGSDCPPTGTFECSDPEVNRLYQNIVWGQRSNFLSVPTDCPQRDERMGWMGDAQVFAPTAACNADVAGFFTKWMIDVDDGQHADGQFNNVNPVANQTQSYPVWADAGVVIPWEMYLAYGDKAFLERDYDAMARWVDYGQRTYPDLLRSGGVGDHLAPMPGGPGAGMGFGGAPGARRGAASGPAATGRAGVRGFGARGGFGGRGGFGAGGPNPTSIVDTAFFAHSAWILAQSATLLGKPEDAKKYDDLFHAIVDAFNKAYVQPDGTITTGTQTCYCLALRFNLLPENLRAAAAQHLLNDIQQRGHLTTGFVGVGQINPTLTAIGRSDVAYQLLFTDTYPSWLFTVKQGATTMWERWDGWTPETGFQASSMNSFNHYSFGAVGLWLYSGVAGIQLDPAQPGYKHFMLDPQFTPRLSYAKATMDSPYGVIASSWRREGDVYTFDATVPPNTTAELRLPVAPANYPVIRPGTVELAAGRHHFTFPASAVK